MARKNQATQEVSKAPSRTKLSIVEELLKREGGSTIDELMTATGWQQHSIRGVMSGTLRKRGLVIVSAKLDGVRRYSIGSQ